MSQPKTEQQLKNEWGDQRFITALGILSGWHLDKRHPISKGQLLELQKLSNDAFLLFGSRLYYKARAARQN